MCFLLLQAETGVKESGCRCQGLTTSGQGQRAQAPRWLPYTQSLAPMSRETFSLGLEVHVPMGDIYLQIFQRKLQV